FYSSFNNKVLFIMKKIVVKLTLLVALCSSMTALLSSCSNNDYVNAIPENSIAVVAVDLQNLLGNNDDNLAQLKSLIMVENVEDCGIDVSQKVFVFETEDGNIGCVAKVSNKKKLDTWLNQLADKGYCKSTSKRKDFRFTTIKNLVVVGFSSKAIVAMGPVLPFRQAETQKRIAMYLEQDEEKSIKGSPVFDKLNDLDGHICLVAQAAALPDNFVAPFILGAPKEADASQIMLAAEMNIVPNVCIEIKGETFSFNKTIDSALKESSSTFRPITGKYVNCMPATVTAGVFMNIDGKRFIEILHSSAFFSALLSGMNTAIDLDNIIRSVDGDLSVVIPEYNTENTNLRLAAQLANKDFLNDIDYWKESCPNGTSIADWGKDSYFYSDGNISYYFGVSDDMQYFSGGSPDDARQSIIKASNPLTDELQKKIIGQRMCIVLNIGSLGLVNDFIEPLLGNIHTVIYSIK
ncbi:MAG: DUF4836 family protein, partial [Prevotella sp.]|nr:DUF4836 family protein [Prevotella sp.]